jgi:predicted GH43/DUF377 family glycosyl hydrolase
MKRRNPNPTSYSYDPRFVKINDTFYIVWCDDMRGASIGLEAVILDINEPSNILY